MDNYNEFSYLKLSQKYEVNLSQPKVVNTKIFFQDTNSQKVEKLRNANLYYPCINMQTKNNLSAQLIYKEPKNIVEQEIAVLNILCQNPHTNIIKIYDIIETSHWYVIEEDITLNLEDFMKNKQQQLSNEIKKDFFRQLVQGFKHLISHKIILRDLQPQHIFVKIIRDHEYEYILKISNFRSAEFSKNGQIKTLNGMSEFAAPETLTINSVLTNSCCIYTLGMLLYYIQNDGKKPFQAKSYQDLIKLHNEFCESLSEQNFSNNDDDFLKKQYQSMCKYDEGKRIKTIYDEFCQHYYLFDNIYFLKKNSQIGYGGQGVVYDALNIETKDKYVCKIVQRDSKTQPNKQDDQREIKICEHLEGQYHQNIIKIIKIIRDPQQYFIFQEKCDKNVSEFMNNNQNDLSDLEIIDFIYQIVQGYSFLIQRDVVHRDLKPQNIMIKLDDYNNKIYKIIDFGVSKILQSQDLTQSNVGTLYYQAPEILINENGYSNQCDIFSLGILIFEIMFRRQYISYNNRADILKSHQQLSINPFKCPDSTRNPDLKLLIEQMIVYDPAKRINWEQLKNYKFRKYDLDILNDIYFFAIFALQSEQLLFEVKDKYKDDKVLTGDIYAHRSILLKFAQLTFQKIEQSFSQKSISINEFEYKINQSHNFDKWKQNNRWSEKIILLQERQARFDSEQIDIFDQALEVIQNLKIKDSEITLNFKIVHKFFIDLPNLLSNSIIQQNESVKLKYNLLKMRNLFKDFKNTYNYENNSQCLFYDKLPDSQMQAYINSNL